VKILNKILKTSGWALFLLVSTVTILVLLQQPRSISEFYTSLLLIDKLYLLLAMIGSLLAASVITLLGTQEI
jgi:hypothetical protein